ncbi:MAG TPA: thiamine phosphate synthase [Edaphobacter sp.]
MLRYAITQRTLFSGDDRDDSLQQAALVRQAARWAAEGIDFIQLREKDLPSFDLILLARKILEAISAHPTRLLINSNPGVAITTAAHGVHLTAAPNQATATDIRRRYAQSKLPDPVITVSCHTLAEIERARTQPITAILFAPVFEKSISGQQVAPGTGLERLREACNSAAPIPVYALGGVTLENAPQCLEAGAAGVAGIRLFHNPS